MLGPNDPTAMPLTFLPEAPLSMKGHSQAQLHSPTKQHLCTCPPKALGNGLHLKMFLENGSELRRWSRYQWCQFSLWLFLEGKSTTCNLQQFKNLSQGGDCHIHSLSGNFNAKVLELYTALDLPSQPTPNHLGPAHVDPPVAAMVEANHSTTFIITICTNWLNSSNWNMYPPWNWQQKPLKMYGWNTILSCWEGLFSVSGRVTLLETITYPIPKVLLRRFSFFPFGGICDRSLEGSHLRKWTKRDTIRETVRQRGGQANTQRDAFGNLNQCTAEDACNTITSIHC